MIEFWEGNVKKAECPATDVFDLSPEKRESFWQVQDSTGREIRLRIQDETD
jgi:hypothetical protein